jgi:hypothetical protein
VDAFARSSPSPRPMPASSPMPKQPANLDEELRALRAKRSDADREFITRARQLSAEGKSLGSHVRHGSLASRVERLVRAAGPDGILTSEVCGVLNTEPPRHVRVALDRLVDRSVIRMERAGHERRFWSSNQ